LKPVNEIENRGTLESQLDNEKIKTESYAIEMTYDDFKMGLIIALNLL
jgi:hypothetical protein